MEYRCVYGEDAESALRFLFNAMAPKIGGFPFQGRPKMIYLDNGMINTLAGNRANGPGCRRYISPHPAQVVKPSLTRLPQ